MATDLYAAIEQSLIDKVTSEANYPLTIINSWQQFPQGFVQFSGQPVSGGEFDKLMKSEVDCTRKENELACRAKQAQAMKLREIQKVREHKAHAKTQWKGPTDKELDEFESRALELRPFLQHLRIDIRTAPSIQISGTSTAVRNVALSIDATGQIWVKNPLHWVCTKDCHVGVTFCCEGHFEERWDLLAQASVGDFYTTIGGKVDLVVNGRVVYGVPSIEDLRLDYDVLRLINLAPIVNEFLKINPFPLLDAGALTAAVPYANTRYQISDIALSGHHEIRADLTLKKL